MRERVTALVPDREVLREPERTLFSAVAGLPPTEGPATLLASLDGAERVLLVQMLDEAWSPPDLGALVTGAVNRLEARRMERELREIDRRFPLVADDEKPALAKQKEALSRELARLNPGRWSVIRRGRSSAR
jgi:hypothetical protein